MGYTGTYSFKYLNTWCIAIVFGVLDLYLKACRIHFSKFGFIWKRSALQAGWWVLQKQEEEGGWRCSSLYDIVTCLLIKLSANIQGCFCYEWHILLASLPLKGMNVNRTVLKLRVMCVCVHYSQIKQHLKWWPVTFVLLFLYLCRIYISNKQIWYLHSRYRPKMVCQFSKK